MTVFIDENYVSQSADNYKFSKEFSEIISDFRTLQHYSGQENLDYIISLKTEKHRDLYRKIYENRNLFSAEKIDPCLSGNFKIISKIEVDSFLEKLVQKNDLAQRDPYPIAIRYIDKNGKYYIERPPFQVTVDYSGIKSDAIKIWVPWSLTVIKMNEVINTSIYFSDSQLYSDETKYIPCTLPNVFNNGRICFANSIESLYQTSYISENNIKQVYNFVFNEYMSGGWNYDLSPNLDFLYYQRETLLRHYCEQLEKNHPTIFKFLNTTVEQVKEVNPGLRKNSIASVFNNCSYNRTNMFKHMFYVLSTFSLEETLNFYKEINNLESTNFLTTDKICSFKDLKSTRTETYLYDFYPTLIQNTNAVSNLFSFDEEIKFNLILKDYDTSKLLNEDKSLNTYTLMIEKSIIEIISKTILEIYEKDHNNNNNNKNYYFVYDCLNDTFILDENCTDEKSFYLNFLIQKYFVEENVLL